ncbi:MAG: hypothetical protein IRZ28_11925 [Steroidobacteraceae bacterium]|nr:hypothetical protein [Steroidobacteraceae bacterium]
MQPALTRCLRPDVAVRPFDAVEGDDRFVVAVDNRHFLVTAAAAAVLDASRQPGTAASIAQRASARLGVTLSAQQVAEFLSQHAPSILFARDTQPQAPRGPLRVRHLLASGERLAPVLARLAWLFQARVAVALAMAFVLVDVLVAWSAASGTASANAVGWTDLALALALTAAGVFVHELGHLAACVRHGASHGGVGVGLYWCFPTFYSEVHGAWLLGRWQRAAVDAGGVYLQGGFVLLLGLVFLATRSPAVLGAIAWSHLLMLHTLNPVLKFDGYWLLTDLTGTPNLHRNITRTARGVLRAVSPAVRGALPAARDLVVFGVFMAVALVYFAYLLRVLGDGIASALVSVVTAFAAPEFTVVAALELAGRVIVVALLLAMALGIAVLVARSVNSVSEESTHAD